LRACKGLWQRQRGAVRGNNTSTMRLVSGRGREEDSVPQVCGGGGGGGSGDGGVGGGGFGCDHAGGGRGGVGRHSVWGRQVEVVQRTNEAGMWCRRGVRRDRARPVSIGQQGDSMKGAGCMPEDARPGRVRIHRWLSSEWEGGGVAWSGEVRRSVAERAVSVRQ
jgi:hypothetical protein